ncbi:efflux RND transporter permease subunit [Salinarimonas ramus]|uniref:Multidrug resistance protein n=1 Tax=Salinarimonas ramus TaxID=690164 RepID=A0A917QGS2_9HYPH|nr:efflux RND transporter permease subunit [Salinarimonas ramus]GGK48336.1 multidrug resistance protein [Salinarimonas ramus]
MNAIIDAAFSRTRTVVMLLIFVLILGAISYVVIPKESAPDVPIPIVYVSVAYEGIAPDDAERLLVRPLESELQSIEGLSEMSATAAEGYASVQLEFEAGSDSDEALDAVREAVDRAQPELPAGAEEPIVQEVNVALFPILTVVLSGPLPERTLVSIANDLQDRIEGLAGVLEVDIGGDREELLEILIDPVTLETYGISFEGLVQQIQRNNRLIAAGALETSAGRIVLKVPGVIEDIEDVLSLPVKVVGDTVVTFADVAVPRRTFRDPEGFARIDGQPAVALEVKKRIGSNIIETVEAVRALVAERQEGWPAALSVSYLQDESEQIRTMLGDLQNNVLSAIVIVMIVIIATLGLRTAFLVGLSIPGAFLAGIVAIYFLGYTLNIVVLFSLILVVGMLVDGAIVTTELADRRMAEGVPPREAYAEAAKRMAWPIVSSTATTLAVFVPLLFWGGVVGEFMKFLPITVILTLAASLAMALVFIPVLGGMIGKPGAQSEAQLAALRAAEGGDLDDIRGGTGAYLRTLRWAVRRPALTLVAAFALLVGAVAAYGAYGRGIEFFPSVEPDFAQIQVQARGNLSVWEKDALVRRVEARVLDLPELEHVYARTIGGGGGRQLGEDVIGVIQLDLRDWDVRPPAAAILADIREITADIPGIRLEIREQEGGPAQGKPVELQVTGRGGGDGALDAAVETVRATMARLGGFVDVADTRPLPGVEWELAVDRTQAARYGADVTLLGQAVQLFTAGLQVAEYRPETADGEVDIRVRFPTTDRSLAQLEQFRIPTAQGLIPIRNFVEFRPAPRTGTLQRIDARRVITVSADVPEGVLASERIEALRVALADAELPEGVRVVFAGQDEDQREAGLFLAQAFGAAIFLMLIILVTQFNSLYQAGLVLSAIVFSTAGVLLGLLITGRPFGVVMGGIGVIALAGIVVNNNIVLIDTCNDLLRRGLDPVEAVLRTGAQRLRPVVLTSATTVLGLMPMVLGINIDLVGREILIGAPSTQWWTELASAIAGGLTFATVLTLILTPAMLVLGARTSAAGKRLAERFRRRRVAAEGAE